MAQCDCTVNAHAHSRHVKGVSFHKILSDSSQTVTDIERHFRQKFTTKILTEGANIAQEEQRFITFKAILEVGMRWRPAASLCK